MLIKKVVAETMSEAMAQVKRELGADAVILQSRKIEKGGLLSFLSKQMVEVTAATPDHYPPPSRTGIIFDDDKKRTLERSLVAGAEGGFNAHGSGSSDRTGLFPEDGARSTEIQGLRSELSELRSSLHELATHLKYQNAPSLPQNLTMVWRALVDNGVTERNAHDLTQALHLELTAEQIDDEDAVESALHEQIASRFRVGGIPFRTQPGRPLVIALIGPTGVGKTTTLAKMATNRRVFGRMRVGLISTDTYRVAAVEQLKTFAGIAGLPVEVVYRPEELPKAIEALSGRDVVLIDTAGRSQHDSEALTDLQEFMNLGKPDEVLLVLSAGTRVEDQREMVRRFGGIPATRIILTKLDEITSGGHLLDVAGLLPREWVYLTTGQNVPDDIVTADALLLAAMVARKDYFQQLRLNRFVLPGADNALPPEG